MSQDSGSPVAERRGRAASSALLLLLGAFAARAADPIDLVPASALLCWKGRPYIADEPASSQPSAFGTLLDIGARIAGSPLRPREQFAVRLIEGFALAIHYPFAIAVIDSKARPTDDGEGRQVDQLQVALIIDAGGKPEPFIRVIQKAVHELTDSQNATLRRSKAGAWNFDELRDARLGETIAWGQIGELFVLTYGPGVWPTVASVAAGETPSLSKDEWVQSFRDAARPAPLIEVYLAAGAVRKRLDPFVSGRATAFFEAWGGDDVALAHWALGFEDRALYCVAHYRDAANRTHRRVYADPAIRDPRYLQTIPPAARYAIYRLPARVILPRAFAGFYATRDPLDRQRAQQTWARIEAQHEFSADRDIFANLGDTIVLHNDPPHPLKLPLAFTTLIEIRSNPRRVHQLIEKACRAWGEWLDEPAGKDGPNWARLERDSDGIWSFQYGPIAGIAWVVTERFIVASWSPAALRDYLRRIGDHAGAVIRD